MIHDRTRSNARRRIEVPSSAHFVEPRVHSMRRRPPSHAIPWQFWLLSIALLVGFAWHYYSKSIPSDLLHAELKNGNPANSERAFGSERIVGGENVKTREILKPLSLENNNKLIHSSKIDDNTRIQQQSTVTPLRRDGRRRNKLNPLTSIPPIPIQLNQTESAAIKLRHTCIAKIRERQINVLGPLVLQASKEQVLLVDPAYHRNVGDVMLSHGELIFLHRLGFSRDGLQQCDYLQAGDFLPACENVVSINTNRRAALWHAGGNWGDMWRIMQDERLASFEPLLLANFTIIGMPQSLYYNDSKLIGVDVAKMKRAIAAGLGQNGSATFLDTEDGRREAKKRVFLTWREQESLERAQKLYPFVENLLVPDIAFQLGPYEPILPKPGTMIRLDVVVFLRGDRESVYASQRDKMTIRKLLDQQPGAEGLQFMIVDWANRLDIFKSEDYYFTNTSIQLMTMGRVVICDRLHAAILCYLSGVPFVFVDQLSGKLTNTLRVAFDSWQGCQDGEAAMWARATSLEEAIQLAVGFLERYKLGTTRAELMAERQGRRRQVT